MAKKVTRPSHRREDRRPRPPARSTPVARPKQVFPTAPETADAADAYPSRDEPLAQESPANVPPRRMRAGGQVPRPAAPAGVRDEPARARVVAARIRPPAPIIVDYSYVRRDLLRIAVLAGVMLVVLIVLTFFYR